MFSDKVIPSYYATYHIKKNSQKMMNKLITKICKVLFQGEKQRQKVEIVNNDNIICCETLLRLTGDDVVLLFLFFAIVFFFSILYRCDASKIITLDPLTGNDKYGIINFQSRVSGYKKMVENNQRILFTWRFPRPRFCLPLALHMMARYQISLVSTSPDTSYLFRDSSSKTNQHFLDSKESYSPQVKSLQKLFNFLIYILCFSTNKMFSCFRFYFL